jgi:hypothetical protein
VASLANARIPKPPAELFDVVPLGKIRTSDQGMAENAHRLNKSRSRKAICIQMVPGSRGAVNLLLAGRPRVGHIGLSGDVAEWLKAAVC